MSVLGLDYEVSDSDSTPAHGSNAPGESPAAHVQEYKAPVSIVGDAYGGSPVARMPKVAAGEEPLEQEEGDDAQAGQIVKGGSPEGVTQVVRAADLLPPSPKGCVSASLQKIVENLHDKVRTTDFNSRLRWSHQFRNPEILHQLVTTHDFDQFGSCYPEALFNPVYDNSMYFESLWREQNRMLAARQAKAKESKARAEGKPPVTKIVGGNAGVPLQRQTSAGSASKGSILGSAGFGTRTDSGESSKKRSKWDNRAVPASSGNAFADFQLQKQQQAKAQGK